VQLKWKPDWQAAKANLIKWWERKGLALDVTAPRRKPVEDLPKPEKPSDLAKRYTDPVYRRAEAEYRMANTFYGGEAFPYYDAILGPGSLGSMLGAKPGFSESTVWYDPCIEDPDSYGPIRFSTRGNKWWDVHLALIEEGRRSARGRYLLGVPDLIENIDTLAAMRGTEPLLMDLIERPDWVKARVAEINQAFFAAFDGIYELVKDENGGSAFAAFDLWSPGKTAKVQCDFSCMISAEMFREFVVPALAEQCQWLDYSMYHLDGTTAVQHLDALLEIDALDAIEWTPQAGKPGGGSPEWYDLYKRIRAGGKSVQAIRVQPGEVLPLIDAVGPEGLFVDVRAKDEDEARRLIEKVRG
jgi:hypothetical protein